ncbi:hypothetical protein OA081_01870 [Gammaproteobacteria bacterium]|nr:hypothetical protein [Gammaproteobacteria bacterium]
MNENKKIVNDEVDLISLISVVFDNFNFLLSVLLASFFVITIYYFSATSLYLSSSLLEIKNNKGSFLPESLSTSINTSSSSEQFLQAEIEIYKSDNTILDALNKLNQMNYFEEDDIPASTGLVRSNLNIVSSPGSLIKINYVSPNKELSPVLLNLLNEEFIQDRKNFIKQSSSAGREFIKQEIPRIRDLLKIAENNLNSFKVSTNTSDVIFDVDNRNLKLERLKNRVDEIIFKELELKEFYRENHPIYLTLSEQKKLVMSQINEIEKELPNVPNTQRTLENFKREVEIYSNVLSELSSQELSLGMAEASSLSNVRIINEASVASRISPKISIYILSLVITILTYAVLLLRHFLGDRITNLDALADFIGKEKIIGEFPLLNLKTSDNSFYSDKIADELLNKTIYEITHSNYKDNTFSIVSSRKGAGKTEISKRLFNKLKVKYKVCLLDLDYRKKGLTKEIKPDAKFKDFNEFNSKISEYYDENGSLFIPSFDLEYPQDFFTSDEFKMEIERLKGEFDYVLCDTPPWNLFVDAKVLSKYFANHLYIVCNQVSTFRDIDVFLKDFENDNLIKFFYNKFNLYFNFLWYKYQYPSYSRNYYYYDYTSYSSLKKDLSFKNFLVEFFPNIFKKFQKWVSSFLNR